MLVLYLISLKQKEIREYSTPGSFVKQLNHIDINKFSPAITY